MSGSAVPPRAPDAGPPTIRITAEAWRLYRQSLARNPPETFALLGGRLSDPLTISEFFFLPPLQQGGRFVSSAVHVQPDHNALNYLIDRVLVPNGLYMLGLWHSHPGGYTAPSGPDLAFCAAILRNDDSPGRTWRTFLAPITTFDADGRDRVTAWVMRKGTDVFELAVFAPPAPAPVALPVPVIPVVTATPIAMPAVTDAPVTDPLAACAARLGVLLARPDGLVGVPRYRAGVHLHTALRIAECGADGPFRS